MSNNDGCGFVVVSDEVHEFKDIGRTDSFVLINKRYGMSPMAGYKHPVYDAFISLETNPKKCLD